MIKICPNCGERYVVGFDSNDFVHDCNSGNLAIDQDDVVITGNWEDYSSSGTKNPQEVLRQGMENKLFGTLPDVEGEDQSEITRRGNRATTHRQRQHQEFINIKREGLD